MVNRLLANGCSYMDLYALGQGHGDLAAMLGIARHESLALTGSCNARIIRTTLRDSYHNEPTLYVIGTTFLARYDLPSKIPRQDPDGRWLSYNNLGRPTRECSLVPLYSESSQQQYAEFWFKMLVQGKTDVAEDLQYRILSMLDSLIARGHRAVIFNTADRFFLDSTNETQFALLRQRSNIVDGLKWCSVPWQFMQGAAYPPNDKPLPWDCRHVAAGHHKHLNQFLARFIADNDLLA